MRPPGTANPNPIRDLSVGALAAALALSLSAAPLQAHPHVWVSVEATVLFDNGTITGLQQRWLFDEFYSAQAGEGLDKNRDGKLDRSELAELAQVNMEGLKEFEYFTNARLAGAALAFDDPKGVKLEQVTVAEAPGPGVGGPLSNDTQAQSGGSWWSKLIGAGDKGQPSQSKVLALTFTLPFKQPVLADADGFQFTIDDPAYFIWLEFAKKNGATLSESAPKDCKVAIGALEQGADEKRLSEAFGSSGMSTQDSDALKTVRVQCPKG